MAHHAGPKGILFDIPVAVERICVGVDERRLERRLPERPRAPPTLVATLGVPLRHGLYESSGGIVLVWRDQEMNMVRHQDVRMQTARCLGKMFLQQSEVERAVAIIGEAGASIHAAVYDVKRMTGKYESRLARHVPTTRVLGPGRQPVLTK